MNDVVVQFDIDGVLADFVKGFLKYGAQALGTVLPEQSDVNNPCYGTQHIVGAATSNKIWQYLLRDPFFWEGLPASATRQTFERIDGLQRQHRVYFVTNRPGLYAKLQTEHWLMSRGIKHPTVVVCAKKGEFARAAEVTYSIEDKAGNAVYIAYESPETRSFLINRAYNVFDHKVLGAKVTRVESVDEFLNNVEAA